MVMWKLTIKKDTASWFRFNLICNKKILRLLEKINALENYQ